MKTWTGKVRLVSGRTQGEEVTARIIVHDEGDVIVDITRGNDALGAPRWEASGAFALDAKSLCIALTGRGAT